VGLLTAFYCLRFETSLFVASYDSQGYSGGIRPRLYTGAMRSSLPGSLYSLAVTMEHVEDTEKKSGVETSQSVVEGSVGL
jgi:hypothetical protein